jgi:hypothetical protein
LTLTNKRIINQFDGPPQTVSLEYPPNVPPQQTSQWQPGQYYIEEREITIPQTLDGYYTAFNIYMTVYQWWDNTRIAGPGVDADNLFLLKTFHLETW